MLWSKSDFFPPLLQFLCLPYFKRLDNKPQSSNSSDLLTITRGTDHVTVIKLFFLLKEKVFQSFLSSVNTQKILLLSLVEGFLFGKKIRFFFNDSVLCKRVVAKKKKRLLSTFNPIVFFDLVFRLSSVFSCKSFCTWNHISGFAVSLSQLYWSAALRFLSQFEHHLGDLKENGSLCNTFCALIFHRISTSKNSRLSYVTNLCSVGNMWIFWAFKFVIYNSNDFFFFSTSPFSNTSHTYRYGT